jgi:phage-related baseplate assembly protein
MGTPTLDQLTSPLTRIEVEASIYAVLGRLGVATTSWKPGAPTRTMITGVASVVAALSQLQAQIARAGFIETAEGPWLHLVARYVYGVEPLEATFATGEVTLVNAGGGVYELDPDDLLVTNVRGYSFRNSEPLTLGAGPNASIIVAIRAVEAGAASNSAPGEVNTLSVALPNVSVSNAAGVAGTDAEGDAALRRRCYEKLGALSPNGPWDAYSYAARSAVRPDGSAIGVTRTRIVKDGYGNVTTYLANASGAVEDADVATVDEAIQLSSAPLAVTARTLSATERGVAVSCRVWMYNASRTSAQIIDMIEQRLLAFMAAQPIGGNSVDNGATGWIYQDAIRHAIASVSTAIFHVEVTAPASDVALLSNEVPQLTSLEVSELRQVAPPEGFTS